MHKKSLLLLFTLMCINSSLTIDAAQNNAITFDKGLLTRIPGIVTTKKVILQNYASYTGFIKTLCYIKEDTITNLIEHHIKWNAHVNLLDMTGTITSTPIHEEWFNPSIWKIADNETKPAHTGFFQDFKEEKNEIKNAIDKKNAVYYGLAQGILIYSPTQQPSVALCKQFEEDLKQYKL